MSHPRIEEVSDSDLASDPEEVDLDDFADNEIMRRIPDPPKFAPAAAASRPSPPPAAASARAPQGYSGGLTTSTIAANADRSSYAAFQCLYPVYFDATRSRAEGRRVSAALAVKNPLAREIANACGRLGLETLFEPEKTHPKDWANPGRVKVKKHSGSVANKHHLYILVAQHLRAHPTTGDSPHLRVRIGGVLQPEEGKPYPKPAVPRGWKMNDYLPYLSAAQTGGGVSENLFKDMMKEMQGGGDPMAALMGAQGGEESSGGGGGRKKKEKKGKGKA